MTVKTILKEAIDQNPLSLKEAVEKELNARVAAAIQGKVNEAKEESPISGTRKISSHEGKDGHHAEVRYNRDWDEYSVHHYLNGKHMGEGPVSYHGGGKEGKQDATDTAQHACDNMHVKDGQLCMNEEVALVEESLGSKATAKEFIDDFVNSKNPKFEGKDKKERIKMALGAYYEQQKKK